MKVIYIKDQPGVAKKGQVKEVSEGYANNFLIPKGFVQPATKDIQAKVEKEGKEAVAKKKKEADQAQALKADLEKRTFTVKVKVGDKGQIFQGVHAKDVAEVITSKMNRPFEKSQVDLTKPIKELGEHTVKVKVTGGVVANVRVLVEPAG